MLVLFLIFFCCFVFFFPKSLDNLDKIATYSILLKLTLCLLLFQISCGGKSCALFWTGEVLNDESSFDRTNKRKKKKKEKKRKENMNDSERLHTGILCRNVLGFRAGVSLQYVLGSARPNKTWVTEEKTQGLSSRSVCMCASVTGGLGCAAQNIYKEQAKHTKWFLPETLACVQ